MRKWEDIVKEKMEEQEGALPESVFSEFRARRDTAAAAPAAKRFSQVWAVIPAVAVGLAAVLVLHKLATPEGDTQITSQESAPIYVVTDSTTVDECKQSTRLLAQALSSKAVRPSVARAQDVVAIDNSEPAVEIVDTSAIEDILEPEKKNTATYESIDSLVINSANESPLTISSSYTPEKFPKKPIKMKVGPAAGIVAGGGLLAALTTPFLGSFKAKDTPSPPPAPGPSKDLLYDHTHYFPFRVGLSTRIPVTEKLSVTTGLEYSLYSSRLTYSLSGEKTQHAHYLGVPVRLDWTFASNKWIEVYLGGGFKADYCLRATLSGERIAKDGFGFSMLGAGGIQINLTKQLGLYVEPEINWAVLPKNTVLQTYRTDKTMMFSLTSGIRISFGK